MVALLALAGLCPLSAVVYRESFNYPNGTVLVPSDTNGELGIGSWRSMTAPVRKWRWITVNNASVSYGGVNAQDVFLAVGAAGMVNYFFPMAYSNPGLIYFAFDLKVTSVSATGDYFFSITNNAGQRARRHPRRAPAARGPRLRLRRHYLTAFDTVERSFGTSLSRRSCVTTFAPGGTNNPGTLYIFRPASPASMPRSKRTTCPRFPRSSRAMDWDTGIPGPLPNQSATSPGVNLAAPSPSRTNFADALGAAAFTLGGGGSDSKGQAAVCTWWRQSVAITSGTAGATIRYTTDGSVLSLDVGHGFTPARSPCRRRR